MLSHLGFVVFLSIMTMLPGTQRLWADTILWDNGSVAGDTRECDSGPNLCGGTVDWVIYDNFTIGQSVITGFTISDYLDDNGQTSQNYLNTYWGIWAADPVTGSSPITSGTSVAALSPGSLGSTLFTVTALNINLSGGEYWLGTTNNLGADTLTDRAYTTSTVLTDWEQGEMGGTPFVLPQPGTFGFDHSEFNTAFTVEGVATPEPGTFIFVLFGLVICAALVLRDVKNQGDRMAIGNL